MDRAAYRLPTHVQPRHYTIALDARLGVPEFHGRVTAQVQVLEPQNTVELHAHGLQLADVRLAAQGRTLAGEVTLHPAQERAAITFAEPLAVGPATLQIAFRGTVGRGLQGLFLAQDGPEALLCTQCEPTYARAIFPCFDEPEFKARFAWQVTTSADATVLANGPLEGVVEAEGGAAKTWIFAPTRPMSSYLVALVIGRIAGTERQVVAGTPLQVWAPAGKEDLGAFALRYTARLLPWYEDYFAVRYHFDKYDQVAVPAFGGAMENSGLVLFQQGLLLMDPRTTSWQREKRMAIVIAHEFAHMWFGNLVTMRWWDDLWLNEAFADWMAHRVVDALSPEYHAWDDFQHARSDAQASDALPSTHSIYAPVATAAEAEEMFDDITYTKGCAVLAMLENYLGQDAFRAGIRSYMRAFAERNATGRDLWRHLQQASSTPVEQVMESWITQPGYPVVRVAAEGDGALRVSQRRFFSSPADARPEPTQTWPVPLVMRYEDAAGVHEARYLLREPAATVPLATTGPMTWCYANAGEAGFYRQHPDGALLAALLARPDRLTPREQMGLLDDQWALVRNASQSIRVFLDVVAALAAGDHYQVLAQVVAHLHALERLLEQEGDAGTLARLRAWVAFVFAPKLAALGFAPRAGEARNEAQARVEVIDAMANLAEDRAAIAQAEEWAAREAADPASVAPDLAYLVVATSARFGAAARFAQYVDLYLQRRSAGAAPQETERYLHSLPAFRPPELVARTLGLLEDGTVSLPSTGALLGQMLGLPHAQRAAWDYVKGHWAALQDLPMYVPFLVAASGRLPVDLRDDLVAFYEAHLQGRAQHSYARALAEMDQWAEFRARTKGDLAAWLTAAVSGQRAQ